MFISLAVLSCRWKNEEENDHYRCRSCRYDDCGQGGGQI